MQQHLSCDQCVLFLQWVWQLCFCLVYGLCLSNSLAQVRGVAGVLHPSQWFILTPRYRSEAEGEGLRGPFFVDLSVYLSICQSVNLYRFAT
jgi:hypothetical protein